MRRADLMVGLGALGTVFSTMPGALAQTGDFSGQTISIYVGTGAGSTYDIYARLAAEHLGAHLPGKPKVIVQNKPGAGGAVAAAFVYNVAPKDGTVLATVQQNVPLFQVLSPDKVKFDLGKANWIGTFTDITSVIGIYHNAGIKSLEDAKKKEVIVASTGQGSETFQVPTVLNSTLGTKFRVVVGFKGVGDMDVAIERGEVMGRGGSLLSWTARKPKWVSEGKVVFPLQIGLVKDKIIPNVPLLLDLAKDDKTRQIYELMSSASAIGRSLFAPPGVPAARVAMLRTGFDKLMADPKFKADAEKRKVPINPSKGAEIQAVVQKTIDTPKDAVAALKKMLGM